MSTKSKSKKVGTRKKVARKNVVGPKAKNPKYRGLRPWQPGQSGNPQGGSRKRTRKVLLKEWLQDAINIELPEDWRARLNTLELDGDLSILLEKDGKIAQAIVTRVVAAALQGDFKAIELILGSEPKSVEGDFTLEDATQDGVADTLAGIAKRKRKKSSSKRA
jgi:hypothetical protein